MEKYLNECLDSLVNQTIDRSKYEIVVVNDGSTDSTENIAKSFKGIKVISQKNKGLSGARNTAIKNSSGEWIVFVDADDYVSKDFLEIIETANPIEENFILLKEVKDKEAKKQDKKIQSNKMDDSIVARAVKKEVFNSYSFPEKYKYAIEDWDFYVHNLHKLKIIDLRDKEGHYWYRYNGESLSKANRVYRSRLEHAILVFETPDLRKNNLNQGIIGHYYEHMYMMARLWFPDLLERVKKIRFKTKVRLSIKMQYWLVKIGILNWFIRKQVEKIEH